MRRNYRASKATNMRSWRSILTNGRTNRYAKRLSWSKRGDTRRFEMRCRFKRYQAAIKINCLWKWRFGRADFKRHWGSRLRAGELYSCKSCKTTLNQSFHIRKWFEEREIIDLKSFLIRSLSRKPWGSLK